MFAISIWVLYIVICLNIGFDIIPKIPIVCDLSEPPSIYQLNHTVDCRTILNRHTDRQRQNVTLFKLNLNKYSTKVWSCQKLKRTDIVYKSFGPTYKLNQKILSLFITVEQCRRMVDTKMCPTRENLHFIYQQSEEIWSTNLTSTINPKPFQVKSYNVTNCILTVGTLWQNRLTGKLESNLGTVAHCKYSNGYCNLSDHRHLVWKPNQEAKCSFLPWKNITGYFENNVWYSTDGEPTALTFEKNMSLVTDECGHKFYKSLQGMGIIFDEDIRKKRNTYETAGYNPVTQAELNMKLQGIVSQLLMSPDVNGLSASCSIAQEVAYSWYADLYKNPTPVIRRILRTPLVKAEIRGRAMFIWTCNSVDSYTIFPMKEACTNFVPITFNFTTPNGLSKALFGYLNPSTNEILTSSMEINCNHVGPLVLELNGTFFCPDKYNDSSKYFRYNYKFGLIPFDQTLPSFPTYFIPSITHSRNITFSLLSSIVYKSNSMYNRSEYMHYVDLNDLHKFMDHEKLKTTMFHPVIKLKDYFTHTISLPDLKRTIGQMFTGLSTWWSFFYWFAVIAGAIFLLYLCFKLFCLCNKTCYNVKRRYSP